MYIHRAVIDANVINARQSIPAMNDLEALHRAGVLEICQTSVLPVEFMNAPTLQRSKATIYEVLGGPNWIGHSELTVGAGRRSRFDDIYYAVFGRPWRKVGPSQDEIDSNALRDAIHVDISWINRVDFFLTNDGAILRSRDQLYAVGIDVRIQRPEECLAELTHHFLGAFGTVEPEALAERLRRLPPILLGSNASAHWSFRDTESGETLLEAGTDGNTVSVACKLYDSTGDFVVCLVANQALRVERDDLFVWVRGTETRPSILLGDQRCDRFAAAYRGEVLLSGRICPSGHALIEGKFHNSAGRLVLSIDRAGMSLTGAAMN